MAMYKCPKCGWTDKFYVDATANVEIDGDTGYVEDHDGFSWFGDSIMVCSSCYHEATEEEFRTGEEA